MKTKKKLWFYAIALLSSTVMLFISCEKDNNDDNNAQQNFVDADGNVYSTVIIGDQEWLAENLRTTKYNDGASIPTGHTNTQWNDLVSGAFAIYPYSEIEGLNSNADVLEAYGVLYNWYAVATGKLCPTGWRVPTEEDWAILFDYIGGDNVAGGKLKSTLTSPDSHPRWESPNTGATNASGFSALPSGFRYSHGPFSHIGFEGYWWTYEGSSAFADCIFMVYNYNSIYRSSNGKNDGLSVRCIKD